MSLSLTLLGTGTPAPLTHRAGSGYLVRSSCGVFMFDCGPGTVRRLLEVGAFEPGAPVETVMTKDPKFAKPDQPVTEAATLMRSYRVDQVPVVDDAGRPVGLLDVQELLALRFL